MRTIHSHLPILFSLVLGLLFLGSCETDNYSDSITEAPLYQTHYRLYHDSGMIAEQIAYHYQVKHGDSLYPLGETVSRVKEVAQTIPQFVALNQDYNLRTWFLRKLLYDPNLLLEDVMSATSLSENAQVVLSRFIDDASNLHTPIPEFLDAFQEDIYADPDLTHQDKVLISTAISLMHFAIDSGGDDDDWTKSGDNIFKTALYAANQNTATAIIAVTVAVLVTTR